ncbi:MAG: discoidin domain-containing protein [Clostridia bacterium]|nr:discoidin domain-containing protein [Clostridia bacterium]
MKRFLCIALSALLLLALTLSSPAEEAIETVVTIVRTPEQDHAERPPCFPDPADQFIPLPETENYALNKPASAANHADVYVIKNVNDGKTDTYWESKGFPAEVVIDLQGSFQVSTVAVCLNPSSIWEPRIQEIAVQLSLDGETYAEAAQAADYQFSADTGNRIRIDFTPAEAAVVKVIFLKNSSSRTMGAQAAEIGVY